MKKILQKMLFAGFGGAMLIACSTEDIDEQMNSLDAIGTSANLELADDISANELVGRWELVSMTSVEVAVDLDGNSTTSTDILSETPCFKGMYFDFDPDGVVRTKQARLYFNETGYFTCDAKEYQATYGVDGNVLGVTFAVKGISYTETREISIENDGTNDFLKVSLTGAETDAAVYVNDGRENTVAADIIQIDFVYIRK